MAGVRQYVISVVTAALISGLVSSLFEEGTGKKVVQLLCGLFLTMTILSPLGNLNVEAFLPFDNSYSEEGASAAAQGETMAKQAVNARIKQQAEAYILEKAAKLNAVITATVTVNSDQTLSGVTIRGTLSPYARVSLEEIIAQDLGISKENQIWAG